MFESRRSVLPWAMAILALFANSCGGIVVPGSPEGPAGAATAPMLVTVEVTRIVEVTREIPVTVEVTRVSGLPVTGEPTVDIGSIPYEVGSLTGTYGWSTDTQGQGCQLAVMHRLLMTSQHILEFELLCNRGGPSFNLGYLAGLVPMQNDVGLYSQWNGETGESCSIVFDLSAGDAARVLQLGTDSACGFGQGVDATGTYPKLDANLPTIGCLNPERVCP